MGEKQRGFTLIEILVATGLLGILIFLAMGAIAPLLALRKQLDAGAGLHLVSTYLRECISNDIPWQATVSDPANKSLACLREKKPCEDGQTGPIRLKVSAGENCMAPYDTMAPSTTGFRIDGTVCEGFKPTSGNDACPLRMDVSWTARCPLGEKRCINPLIMVKGQMIYRPAKVDEKIALNPERFQIMALRGRADGNRHFTLYETQEKGVPGGTCFNTGVYRKFVAAQTDDPGGYVRQVAADGRILLEPGTYECQISAPAHLVGPHRAMLFNLTRKKMLLLGTSEFAPNHMGFTPSRSEVTGMFTLAEPTQVAVMHFCGTLPADSGLKSQTLGVPTGLGTELYAVMRCNVIGEI